jgi:hypothetical protein
LRQGGGHHPIHDVVPIAGLAELPRILVVRNEVAAHRAGIPGPAAHPRGRGRAAVSRYGGGNAPEQGAESAGGPAFVPFLAADVQRWAEVVRVANVKAE